MKKILLSLLAIGFTLSNCFGQTPDANGIIYVNISKTNGTGNSWTSPTKQLADALKAAKTNTAIQQIWVAKGTYKPLYRADNLSGANPTDRDNAFVMVNNVKIYGGFDPDNGISNLTHNRIVPSATGGATVGTILSGDFNDNDVITGSGNTLSITNNTENAYNVVISSGAVGNAELNGFTIIGGNANNSSNITVNGNSIWRYHGGGMCNLYSSSPIISQCSFTGNNATSWGGGMYNSNSSPSISQSSFTGNNANYGGGMFNAYSSPSISQCSFTGNNANYRGGGMYNAYSSPKLINVTLANNKATGTTSIGGCIYYDGNSGGSIINSILYGNTTPNNNSDTNREEIWSDNTTTNKVSISNSIVRDYNSGTTLNITANNVLTNDPLFTNSAIGDYTLQAGSPAINAGSNTLYTNNGGNLTTDKDLAGNPRLKGGTIDMGAYESPYSPIPIPNNGIIYVKQNGAGTFTGNSWANAAPELADALKAAKTNTAIQQIWVAKGTYKPLYRADNLSGANPTDRDNAFVMVNNVKLYGGFDPDNGITNLTHNRIVPSATGGATVGTILSGDFNGNDVITGSGSTLSITNNTENAYNVVISSDAVGNAELNGFTIIGGNAYNSSYIHVNGNSIGLNHGGGMYNANSSPSISQCSFTGNNANYGGGMFNTNSSSPSISQSSFTGNNAAYHGGGMYNNISSPSISQSSFTGNNASDGGGMYNNLSSPKLINVTLANNKATGTTSLGGGIYYNSNSGGSIINSILYGNITPNNAADTNREEIWSENTYANKVSISNSIVRDYNSGTTLNITANNVITSNPLFTNSAIGDLTLQTGSPAIDAGSNSLYEAADGNTGNNSLATDKDLAGNPRVYNYANGGVIDMGAYEYQSQPQTINPIATISKTYGNADFEPGATATSGLTVSYVSANNSIAEAYQDAADGNKWKIKIKKAGTVQITASQAGNSSYDAATDVNFTLNISPKAVNIEINPTAVISKVYDGNTQGIIQTTDLQFATGDIINTDVVNLNLSSTAISYNTPAAGTGKSITLPYTTLTLSGADAGNYSIANTSDLSANVGVISQVNLTITANNQTKIYDGIAYSGGNGISYAGFVNGEDVTNLQGTISYGGTAQNAINTGIYSIIPSGLSSNNYNISYVDGSLTISTNNVNTLSFNTQTANSNIIKIYGDGDLNASAVASSGLQPSYSSSQTNVATVDHNGQVKITGTGTTTITVNQAGNSNYGQATAISLILQVNKKTLAVKANDAGKVYDGNAYTGGNGIGYTGFVNGENQSVINQSNLSYGGTSQGATQAGTYSIVPNGLTSTNYDFDYQNGTLTINQAGANIITFNNQQAGSVQNLIYGQTSLDASAQASSGLPVSYSSSNPSVAVVNTNGVVNILKAGTTKITASQSGNINYPQATSISFDINVAKKDLTITANNQSKVYDGIAYSGGNGISYSGFVNGENATNLQGTLSYGGTAQGAKNVNSYFISPQGYTSDNYAITYQDGSLTIIKADLSITANNQTKIYGTADPALTYSFSGLTGGDTQSIITGSLSRATGENSGDYDINQNTLTAGNNYNISYVKGNFKITKADLSITANNQTKIYGTADPALTYSFSGLTGGDTQSIITGSLSRVTGENSGDYDINQNTLTAGNNYNISYVKGNFKITKADLSITANNQTKIYGTTDPALTYSFSGLTGGDTQSIITGSLSRATGENSGDYDINQNTLTAGNNYNISYVKGSLKITKANLSITANNQTKIYGTTDPALTYTVSGLTGGDTQSIITGSLSRATGENTGDYDINQNTLTAGNNYNISYAKGNFKITKANLTVTVSNSSRCFGQANPTFAITYSGFKFNDNENSLITKPTATSSANTNSTAGNYAIAASGAVANNYSFTYVNGILRVDDLPIATIVPSITKTLAKGLTIYLTASGGNAYSWTNAQGIISGQNTAVLTARPSVTTTYTVTVSNANGCSSTLSYTVMVEEDITVLSSNNLLTPNNDGQNDVWKVENIDMYQQATVKIFDRAGRILYVKKGYDNTWDGTYKGQPLAEGTYYYVIDLEDRRLLKGYITLVRDR